MTEIEIIHYYITKERNLHEQLQKDLAFLKQELQEREAHESEVLIQACKNRIEKKQYRIIEATERFIALQKALKSIKGEK